MGLLGFGGYAYGGPGGGGAINLQSPGPIGDVTPGPATFTTLTVGPGISGSTPSIHFDSSIANGLVTGFSSGGNGCMDFNSHSGFVPLRFHYLGAWINSNQGAYLGFGSLANGNPSTQLREDGPGILAQRNGTNPQTFRLSSTYTDESNYERLSISTDATGIHFDSQAAGTGVVRPLWLDSSNAGVLVGAIGGGGKLGIRGINSTYDTGFLATGGGDLVLYGPNSDNTGRINVKLTALTREGVSMASTAILTWTNNAVTYADVVTVGLGWAASGVLKVTNGGAGTGTLRFRPPTSATGLASGELWNNAGTLTIVP